MNNEILYLYPNAILLADYVLQDDGQGVYIKYWNESKLGIKPTNEALQAVSAAANVIKIQEVTMRQARLALLQIGKLETVKTMLASMTGAAGEAARIEFEYSNTLIRNKPLVISMGASLGYNAEQLDSLFALANSL